MPEPGHLVRSRNAQRNATTAYNDGDMARAEFWAHMSVASALCAITESLDRPPRPTPAPHQGYAHITAPRLPTPEEARVTGTFGHVWPCALFYVGNWTEADGGRGYVPLAACTSPADCKEAQ